MTPRMDAGDLYALRAEALAAWHRSEAAVLAYEADRRERELALGERILEMGRVIAESLDESRRRRGDLDEALAEMRAVRTLVEEVAARMDLR